MLFTDYMLKNTYDASTISKEDFKYFTKHITEDTGIYDFQKLFYSAKCMTMFFDKGVIIFEFIDDIQNEERICYIYALVKRKKGKQSENFTEFKQEFCKFAKLNKCQKITMHTKIPQVKKIFEDFGFKLKTYKLELNLT
tara:strand:+ start:193 stop:609 length:417 start_codon:yes stop_codon:yes gene_type:complete